MTHPATHATEGGQAERAHALARLQAVLDGKPAGELFRIAHRQKD